MNCRICGAGKSSGAFNAREMMYGSREEFAYSQCSDCGTLQIVDVPADLARYYPDSYYSFSGDSDRNCSMPVPVWCLTMLGGPVIRLKDLLAPQVGGDEWEKTITRRVTDFYFGGTGVTLNSRILDVGCGSGSFLRSLRNIGFTNLHGIDLFVAGGIKYENGLTIVEGTILNLDPEQKFDLIMFNHSFEHVPNPVETIRAAAALLSNEGLCLIRVPTVSSYAWERYGINWANFEAPRHLFIPSIESIGILAKSAGLKLEKAIYDSTSMQFWASQMIEEDTPIFSDGPIGAGLFSSRFSLRQFQAFERESQTLNESGRGDMVAFYFRPDRPASDRTGSLPPR
jgi:SAM-dependent methyltransferase